MTVDEVRQALGLMDFDDFEQFQHANNDERFAQLVGDQSFRNGDVYRRQTGRTTRLLCEALAAASQGFYVVLRAPTTSMTNRFIKRFERMAKAIEVKPWTATGPSKTFVDEL
jgi:hypothetical protein